MSAGQQRVGLSEIWSIDFIKSFLAQYSRIKLSIQIKKYIHIHNNVQICS